MTETRELPPDFDWVTARQNCSISKVFESLLAQAKKNVQTAQTVSDGRVRTPADFTAFDGGFSVFRNGIQKTGVRFWCSEDAIYVEDHTGKTIATAGLTLNDFGQCRLVVDGKELDQWQLLKRTLEPLLFATGR
jgi:hypothetical protein